MHISFNINFHTVWGQTVYLIGSLPELGAWNTSFAKEMFHTGDGNWKLDIELPNEPVVFEYRYLLKSNNNLIFEEWQKNHKLNISDIRQTYILVDYWQNCPQNMAYYSSAFIKSWFAHPCDKFERVVKSSKKLCIKVLTSEIKRNCSLALVGNRKELGNWDLNKALIMACEKFPEWSILLDASSLSFPIEYKFCIVNNEDKSLVQWEKGENRYLSGPAIKENEILVVSGLQFRGESFAWRCAGTVIPVFSLRSEKSFGIGDFADLKICIDWLKLTSQKILQLLPLNDTTQTHTWLDSYPYNAVSIYALHPIYLSLNAMGTLNNSERQAFYNRKQQELNALDEVDYEQVDKFKWLFFREIYAQDGDKTLKSPEFLVFFEANKDWLIPYAAYSYLRDINGTSDFQTWSEHRHYNREAIENFCLPNKPYYPEIALYYYLQLHLHQQLTQARDYAYARGIVLKGDIPIGISKTSIEAWTDPDYFNMHCQTGAPPDDFSLTGQNWGFPTYNWKRLEEDNFNWWKKRFCKMADYFDAYRIDHILGFFRIWEIPEDSVQGLLGCFSPALPMSVDEIESAGLNFALERFTNAHINEKFLPELFGEYTEEVAQVYLDRSSSRHFAPKEKFNTQQKIQQCFAGKDDEKSRIIREGLYAVCNEVLFIKDKKQQGYFHPRISASNAYIYRELDNSDKYAFDYLYWNYFYQRHNEFWKEEAYKKLIPLISSSAMLACGEDLGMIPHCVPEVMHKLQIFSLEIEQMPKEPHIDFANLQLLPYHSVCTTSTHDMPTLRIWWQENQGKKNQEYYNKVLKRDGTAPAECEPDICEQIILNHLKAPSMLVVIPLQDWLSVEKQIRRVDENAERINIPAHHRHYWKYRMHLTLENLVNAQELNKKINCLILATKR
ncbi:MAG: 4-alpha-glucanotransferase [Candidatus Symbiothrix sp.]|jgi:4-alpha-glucanotransferase|nr:4-alpha-glucanotransferase [Candidatus Symbiothrix sp.]